MVQRKQDPPTAFTAAVHAEIRGWMGKRNMSQRKLGELAGIPRSTLSRLIGTDVQPLNLNELEALCDALGVSPQQVVADAERAAFAAQRAEAEQATPAVGRFRRVPGSPYPVYEVEERPGYDLAARRQRDTPEPSEEDYF